MNIDFIPLWLVFILTVIFVIISIDLGYRLGNSERLRSKGEKESAVSASSAAVLSLLAFLLVFSFGIVYERYDSKKELVREEANLIRTTWLRADFMPDNDSRDTKILLKKYVDDRVSAAVSRNLDTINSLLKESKIIQNKLWNMALINARKDMNSDVAALYIESLNDMFNLEAMRIAIGVQARIPLGIWALLYLLVLLGMFSMGYLTSIAGSSRKSWTMSIMVLSFSLIIILIASLDRPSSDFITISQEPLTDLRSWMNTVGDAPLLQGDTIRRQAGTELLK
ncbi:MAG: DUF4239 domain-containing protein [Ignavibacteriae bacterium]|nr:DUF4239 domain-containing protein [Ignavibacteriota bacterium]